MVEKIIPNRRAVRGSGGFVFRRRQLRVYRSRGREQRSPYGDHEKLRPGLQDGPEYSVMIFAKWVLT